MIDLQQLALMKGESHEPSCGVAKHSMLKALRDEVTRRVVGSCFAFRYSQELTAVYRIDRVIASYYSKGVSFSAVGLAILQDNTLIEEYGVTILFKPEGFSIDVLRGPCRPITLNCFERHRAKAVEHRLGASKSVLLNSNLSLKTPTR